MLYGIYLGKLMMCILNCANIGISDSTSTSILAIWALLPFAAFFGLRTEIGKIFTRDQYVNLFLSYIYTSSFALCVAVKRPKSV